jgi:hypothetical protein
MLWVPAFAGTNGKQYSPQGGVSMKSRLKILIVLSALATPQIAAPRLEAAGAPRRVDYTAVQYLKNFALSACITEGYRAEEVKQDGSAAAGGYLELGSLPMAAYEKAAALGKAFLARDYRGKHGETLTLMKCIDLFNSKELEQLARKYGRK